MAPGGPPSPPPSHPEWLWLPGSAGDGWGEERPLALKQSTLWERDSKLSISSARSSTCPGQKLEAGAVGRDLAARVH